MWRMWLDPARKKSSPYYSSALLTSTLDDTYVCTPVRPLAGSTLELPHPAWLQGSFLPVSLGPIRVYRVRDEQNVHTQMLELRAKDRVEATTLDHIIGTYLAQFVKDVAQETLRAGLLAKKRAEDEVTTALGLRL